MKNIVNCDIMGSDVVRILWVSRHTMTEAQINDLKRIYGNIVIEQLDKTVRDASDVISSDIDVYAAVLPTDILAELKSKTDAHVIRPVSERVKSDTKKLNPATGTEETEYVFKHIGWQEIEHIEIRTKIL